MDKWTDKISQDKLVTRIVIIVVALLCLFFLFSCKGSDQHMSLPDTSNDTIDTTTDSITVINDDKAEETANSTGLEETTDTTETIEEVEEVEEPVNETVIDTLSQPDTTNVIK